MRLRGGFVGIMAAGLVPLTACGVSLTPLSSDAPPGATATTTQRDLGPEPGPAAYRALDVCRIVDVRQLQTAYREAGGAGQVSLVASSPSSCAYGTPAGIWARLVLDDPRDRLPPEVLTTDPGIDKVDVTEAGTIIHDPAFVTTHILSPSGYLLKVSSQGGAADNGRLAEALAKSVREGLHGPLPRLDLPETSLGGRDICAAVRSVGLAEAVGATGKPEDSVDGRVCGYPSQFWVSFYGRATVAGESQASPVKIGRVTALMTPMRCEVIIPLRAAPAGAAWEHDSLLARQESPGRDCDAFLAALEPLVEDLAS